MKKSLLSIIFIIFVSTFFVISCDRKENSSVQKNQVQTTKTIRSVPFQPSQDSSITIEQIKAWLACNPILDSLTIMYSDSFKTKDPKLRMRYQKDFTLAQDKICVLSGLSGGFIEYKWILTNMGNPKNKPVLDSVKVETN